MINQNIKNLLKVKKVTKLLRLTLPVFRIRINLIRIRIWIRIQHFRLNTYSDPDPIQIQGIVDQKLKKNVPTYEKS